VLNRFFTRLAISLAMVLIALVAAVTAIAYFAFALYLLLLPVVVPAAAAVLTGILVLLTALVLIGLTRVVSRPRRGREPSPSLEACESAAELGTEVGRRLRGLADAHASGGLIAALVAGFAVGISPKLRAFLRDILKP